MMAGTDPGRRDKRGILFGIGCCLAYFAISFYMTSIGAAASALMDFWRMDAARQGLILTLQSVCGILLAVLIIFLGNRLNKVRVVLVGLCLMTAAYALMALSPSIFTRFAPLFLIALPAGIGVTSIDVMVNGVVLDTYREKGNTVLSIAHASFSVGAFVAPLAASALIRPETPLTYGRTFWVGGVVCALALILIVAGGGASKTKSVRPVAKPDAVAGGAILRSPRAWLYLVCGLFYFCFLWGVTAWLPSYCQSVAGFDYRLANFAASGFFFGALVMRFLTPLFLKKLSQQRLFLLASGMSGLCMLGAVLASLPAIVLPLVILSGFFQGTLVICHVMMCCAAFPADTAGASSLSVLAGTLGMFVAPFIMGVFSDRFSFRVAMCFAIGCIFCSCLLALVTSKLRREDGA
jgi:fucose permease